MSSFTTERRTEEERDGTRGDEDKLWGGDILWANGKLESASASLKTGWNSAREVSTGRSESKDVLVTMFFCRIKTREIKMYQFKVSSFCLHSCILFLYYNLCCFVCFSFDFWGFLVPLHPPPHTLPPCLRTKWRDKWTNKWQRVERNIKKAFHGSFDLLHVS